MHNPFDSLTDILSWLCDHSPPDAVTEQARYLLIDTLGCYLSGIRNPEVLRVVQGLTELECGPIKLPGLKQGLSVSAAAYVFAMAACWDEACEGLARAHGRPGVATVAAAVSIALHRQSTLGELLRAVMVGYEVAGRLGEVMRIRPGMHVDATFPSFGSAAAVACLLGQDAAGVERAIQTVAIQLPCSLYLPIKAGSNTRNTYLAHAATLGIQAAVVAQAGINPPANALATAHQVTLGHDTSDQGAWLAPQGQWLLNEGYFKPFAAVRHVHYGAAAAALLRGQWLGRSDWDRYRLEIYEEATVYCGNRSPTSTIQAQFSLSWGVAAMLVLGDLGPSAFTEAALKDSRIRDAESRVVVSSVKELGEQGQRAARLTLSAGEHSLVGQVNSVKGDADNPMLPEDLQRKFVRYAAPSLGQSAAELLLQQLLVATNQATLSATIV